MTTRCKLTCESVEKVSNWDKTKSEFLYRNKFSIVTCGSPENEAFFKSTPAGTVELCNVGAELFVPGKSYYVDFTEVA